MTPSDYGKRPMVFDIGNFRSSDKIIATARYYADQLTDGDLSNRDGAKSGLSTSERQQLQIDYAQKLHAKKAAPIVHLDHGGLSTELAGWRYPLNFIDFETTMSALPFNKGRRPYETLAFQFSHHIMHRDGRIEHHAEYIHRKRGNFPNFAFVRELKKALQTNDGSIFRYAAHENTVLCHIHDQLDASREPDRDELMEWIRTVTKREKKDGLTWSGKRIMIDLCDLVRRFHWSSKMGGSVSIKKVLPAILADSDFLNKKYGNPHYGSEGGITSLNFTNQVWLRKDSKTGEIVDPYSFLPPIFPKSQELAIDRMFEGEDIANGGAAMMAYAKTQFTEMSDAEANGIFDALLRYCELDTLAMVMLVEYWTDKLRARSNKVS
jgi:hypothetical protein